MQSNVIDYLQIFFRRKHLFLYPFILVVFLAVVASFILPKTYQSSALILIEEENVINPLIRDLAVSTSVTDRMRVLREQILSWKNITELVRRLKLDTGVRSQLGYEDLIKGIREQIIVDMIAPQVVRISYQGQDPEQVHQVAKTLTEIFIQQNKESKTLETDVAVDFLQEQLKYYRRKIKEDEIKNLQEQLDTLRVDSTEKHPLVQSLQNQINRLRADLDKDIDDIKIKIPPSSQNQNILSYLLMKEMQKSGPETLPGAVPSAGAEALPIPPTETLEGLPLDSSVNERIYGMLLERLETAKITKKLEAFKEGTRFTIIDPPRLPIKPLKPDPIKFLLLGVFAGIAAGIGCIYAAEALDHSYKGIHDAKDDLDLPVLGAISTIVIEDEFIKQQEGARFTYTVMAVFLAVLVIFVLVFAVIR
ncbi:MAG: Wzz/FepE/Etk N-terminal domain-containing protein [Candidatus Omnitrophica bacterium]|nr:Wzz/FepE/Etk N-terminal domain-containing protein [Candidatus Omnitrophota bacterium]